MTDQPPLYIAADHAGFARKQLLAKALTDYGYVVSDLGAPEFVDGDDYPQYAFALGRRVTVEPDAKGILLCGSGQGVCIAANKVAGIRAVSAFSPEMAASTKTDDNANVLCLPARFIDDATALSITKTWLNTQFSEEPRHQRRLAEIEQYEAANR